ncbi:CASP-like protein 4D1 [Alnus glutinosa]|uniref:CASP-like protein 4D1 n=1 Tax=Alnus glutinosa TaxID=3517 RepID=UPI002D789B30|nr:CASP-like protein 4D1 [Alnus glutinosa]
MKKNDAIVATSSLVLRILTLASLLASIALLVTDKITFIDGSKVTFKDIFAYRYVLSIASIGACYKLLQLPFDIYYATKGERLNGCFLDFDFYGDKLISLLLATAVGAGFAVSVEFNRMVDGLVGDFFDKGNIATFVLLVGTICMAVVSVLSSISRTK